VSVTLYAIPPSHPSNAAKAMLERKGMEHKVIELTPGLHAAAVRALGFRKGTVPALKLDGKRVQGSRQISRALESAYPEPRLFPADAQQRLAVEEAERWGEEEFQNTPRMLTRWLTVNRPELRVHMASESGMPAPSVLGRANAPIARYFARKVGADDTERVAAIVAGLPAQLDHIDALIADGAIGGTEPNAADFQIAATARALISFEDLAPLFEGRPTAALAARLLPDYPTHVPAGMVPAEWLAALGLRPGPSASP
jgi:glutathione S-transferase